MNQVIFHIDVNSAFLSWEAVYRIKHEYEKVDLREIPSAIGGDIEQRRGIILAKSTPAKRYGVKTGETLNDALKKCPDLVIVRPRHEIYEQCSKAFIGILEKYSPIVEQYSIDEAFVDMTGTQLLFGEPIEAANRIKDRIFAELGFTVNIGISSNKLLAKMASDFEKPNKVHTLFKDEIAKKMWPLPVSELFFVGRATTKKLFNLGIKTIGDLATTDINVLRSYLKKQGEVIFDFANGKEVALFEDEQVERKGFGNSTTISFDVTDTDTARMVLLALVEKVGMRLRKAGVKAEVISVGIKNSDLRYMSHQKVMPNPTNITKELYKEACELFEEAWNGDPIRHLGVHTSRLKDKDEAVQISLFDSLDFEKQERVDIAIDKIRNKFGTEAIQRATFIDNGKVEKRKS